MKKRKIKWNEFFDSAIRLAERIEEDIDNNNVKIENIYAIPRGGSCLGVALSIHLNLPLLDNEFDITKETLIVDEVTDKGNTLTKFSHNITCVLHKKTQSTFTPDYYDEEIDSDIWTTYGWEKNEEM